MPPNDQFIWVFFLESPALLHAAGLTLLSHRLSLHIMLPERSGQDETMIADPPDPNAPHVYSDCYLSPQTIDGEAEDLVDGFNSWLNRMGMTSMLFESSNWS